MTTHLIVKKLTKWRESRIKHGLTDHSTLDDAIRHIQDQQKLIDYLKGLNDD